MKIKNTPIDELKPYAHNPKTHPEAQIDKIARSIEEFSFLVPILIDGDNSIIAGHGRLLAARKLGLIEIPTICIDHLTEAQIRAFRKKQIFHHVNWFGVTSGDISGDTTLCGLG